MHKTTIYWEIKIVYNRTKKKKLPCMLKQLNIKKNSFYIKAIEQIKIAISAYQWYEQKKYTFKIINNIFDNKI